MADTAPANPTTPSPSADPLDMNTKSAQDMLNWSDAEMEKNMGLKAPTIEDDGEPSADTIIEAAQVETPVKQVEAKPPEAPKAEAPKADTPESEPETPEPETPAKQPLTEFTLYDKDGELEAPSDLTVTYKSNGKLRENVPLDKLVRQAQRGDYNEEQVQEIQQTRQAVLQRDQELERRAAIIKGNEEWFKQVLTDEAFRERAIWAYAEENTPEAELSRMKQAEAERQDRERQQVESQQDAAFVHANIAPRMTQLQEQHPNVPFAEAMGQFNLMIAPYMVRGRVERQYLPTVQHLIESQFAPWIEQLHEQRDTEKKRVVNKVGAEQTKATLAKRQLARAQQPGPVTPKAPTKLPDTASAEDWLSQILPEPKSA